MVALTGQVPTSLLGNDAFQEADITGITLPVTKHSYLVKRTVDVGPGGPGGVLHCPDREAGAGPHRPPQGRHGRPDRGGSSPPREGAPPGYQPTVKGHTRQIEKAIELIEKADRPVIYAGGGIITSEASAELVQLAERLLCPVTTTLMGLGAIPVTIP